MKTNHINKISLCLITSLVSINSFAFTSVVDVGSAGQQAAKEMAADTATMANYMASVGTTMQKMQSGMNSVEQLKNLQGLQKLQAGDSLCRLCDVSDYQQLQDYRQSINTDLCSQFSNAYKNLTGVTNAAKSLQDIANLLTTDPKAAALSLQQASISAAQTTNSTLAQMQMMQAQQIQKQQADEKQSMAIMAGQQNFKTGL